MQNNFIKKTVASLGFIGFLLILYLGKSSDAATFWYSIAIAGLMVLFWLFEVLPIYVTAMFPLVMTVPLGVLESSDLSAAYGHKYIYLFLGGFILSLALEKWDVHKQIAEAIIRLVGTSKARILLGFLLSTGLLSMWISNTATALMMLPMALAVLSKVEKEGESKFSVFLLLSVAYGASVGGIATLVGSPPNVLMAGILEANYGISIDFFDWMSIGLPLSLIMLAVVYLFFYWRLGSERKEQLAEVHEVRKPWTTNQIRVVILFSAIVILWSFRMPVTKFTGFSYTDEGVAVLGAIILFFLPGSEKNTRLLKWEDTKNLPWGILILFGGGMALAKMLELNGVISELTVVFEAHREASLIVLLTVLVTIAIFGTEIMSNMALVSVFVPVVAQFALQTDYTILQLCMPITMAASCAFMLPVGTPPNAIVFSSGKLKIAQMAKTGFVLNLIAVLIVIAVSLILV
ncbi:MAG: SLC13/DASS family transporter [Flavobacteriales bacterium]|nr:SLC13/DASS family transporter [Flavobacteriales bacterium]